MKSRVNGFVPLAEALLLDAARKCHTSSVDVMRDLKTIEHRVKHEGMSFLTITLPTFSAALEKGLSVGRIDSAGFPEWKFQRGLPKFLKGFLSQVFSSTNGVLHDKPSIDSISAIRQICLAFKKIKLPCTPERVAKAFDGYFSCEQASDEYHGDIRGYRYFADVADILWASAFAGFDHNDLMPHHGPGMVIEGVTPNGKYAIKTWHKRLNTYFPLDSYLFCNVNHLIDEFGKAVEVPEENEPPVKVTSVPKTLKAPRIIAQEACCKMYTQQALKDYLVQQLESFWLTAGHVNFTDQSINQELAMKASSDGEKSTLDMSEASDRVWRSHVARMLRVNPNLWGALDACRSKFAKLPNGTVVPLKKFASMGSAVCFPIEAMFFYTVCIAAILESKNAPVTQKEIFKVSRDVYVYGDDIIVPTEMVDPVVGLLHCFNSKVNVAKSFYQGKFRESCGLDAYDGVKVTPTYARTTWPENRSDVSECLSWVASGNQFYRNGYWLTFNLIKTMIEQVTGALPHVQPTCAGMGWDHPVRVPHSMHRFNKSIQCSQVWTWVPKVVYQKDRLNGYDALLKYFVNASDKELHENTWDKWTMSPTLLRSEMKRELQTLALPLPVVSKRVCLE